MGRLNANIKFVVVNVNLFLFWFGLIFFGLACYLWIADWSDGLTAEFFLGTGIIIALMGIIIMFYVSSAIIVALALAPAIAPDVSPPFHSLLFHKCYVLSYQ